MFFSFIIIIIECCETSIASVKRNNKSNKLLNCFAISLCPVCMARAIPLRFMPFFLSSHCVVDWIHWFIDWINGLWFAWALSLSHPVGCMHLYLGRQWFFFNWPYVYFLVCIMKIKVRAFIENAISIDTIHRSNFLIMNWPEWVTVNSQFIIHYRHVRTCVCVIIQFVLQFGCHCYARIIFDLFLHRSISVRFDFVYFK